ncbi:hypothetical protein TNCV_514121 [Trichonephila clavipes]|nr:hypothetical protein TNCV_514121 [Trichonephila clavipes]
MHNDILPQHLARRWVFVTFFRRRHYSAVRSRLGARGTMTTTSYRIRSAVGVRHFFPSRHYSDVRSRLSARGTMTTTSYRIRSAVGVRHLFPSKHYSDVRSCLSARGTMTNDILPHPLSGGYSSLFPSAHLLCCPVASWCTRYDDNDILRAPARRWVFVTFFRRGITLMSGRVLVHAER